MSRRLCSQAVTYAAQGQDEAGSRADCSSQHARKREPEAGCRECGHHADVLPVSHVSGNGHPRDKSIPCLVIKTPSIVQPKDIPDGLQQLLSSIDGHSDVEAKEKKN